MRELKDMDVRELRRLRHAVDKTLEAKAAAKGPGEDAGPSGGGGGRRSGRGTLRREKVSCGKKACKKCADGPSHGPYWYLYYYRNGKLASRYLGKNLPGEFEYLLASKADVTPVREDVPKGRDHDGPEPPPVDAPSSTFRQDELPLFRDG